MDAITKFRGENEFLSNFFPSPISYNGQRFRNAEAAFQSQKTENVMLRKQFTDLEPNEAKKLGRQIPLRPDWEQVKDRVMFEVVRAKFFQNPPLMYKLIHTDDKELIEGNWWGDTYWGVDERKGGLNKLGKILMHVRILIQQ